MTESVFVFGASGHAKVVIDAIEAAGELQVALLVDDAPGRHGAALLGHEVRGGREVLLASQAATRRGVVAIGDNAARLAVARWLDANGFAFVAVRHPSSVIAGAAAIGQGTAIMANVVVNAGTEVGSHVILNTAATVDHDCILEDGVHIAPGCHLCGGVRVGSGAFLGAGTVVIPGIRIGAGAIVGAGSTVVSDVPDGALTVGSPARIRKEVA